jgi:hypothetical protein
LGRNNGTVTVILTALADGLYSLTSGFFPLNPTGVRLFSNSNSKGVSFYENGSVFAKKRDWKDIYHSNCSQFQQESAFAISTFRNTFRSFQPKSAFAIVTVRNNFNKFFQYFT